MNTKKMSFTKKILITVGLAFICSLSITVGLFTLKFLKNIEDYNFQLMRPKPTASVTVTPTPYMEPYPVSEENVSAIVDFAMPALVTVQCKTEKKTTDFWGRPMVNEGSSAGSGVIIAQADNTLYIATNEHVVRDAKTVQVTFRDGSKHEVTVKGSDENADLAVLEIQVSELSANTIESIRIASLGDSETLKAGDFAVAIGNALGYGQSLTVGYISATKREVTVNNITRTLLQTDAAINPGNSGGALLNANGEVIGINSAKYASEDVEGMGYAIPISDAIPVITNIINREALSEKDAGVLGLSGQTVTSTYSSRFGIPTGVYVNSVKPNSAAKKAGIKEGDVIVAINGISISTTEDLDEILSYNRAGSVVTVTVKVLEDNQYVEHVLEVTLDSK